MYISIIFLLYSWGSLFGVPMPSLFRLGARVCGVQKLGFIGFGAEFRDEGPWGLGLSLGGLEQFVCIWEAHRSCGFVVYELA